MNPGFFLLKFFFSAATMRCHPGERGLAERRRSLRERACPPHCQTRELRVVATSCTIIGKRTQGTVPYPISIAPLSFLRFNCNSGQRTASGSPAWFSMFVRLCECRMISENRVEHFFGEPRSSLALTLNIFWFRNDSSYRVERTSSTDRFVELLPESDSAHDRVIFEPRPS